MKPESGGSVEEPGKEAGSVQQEARTCPVCGTRFFAAAESGFCPVCILRGATSGEPASTGESGSVSGLAAANAEEADSGSQARRFDQYEVMLDEAGKTYRVGLWGDGRHLQGV